MPMDPIDADAEQVRRFRLARHGLDRRRPAAELERAVGACGLQNSPPWTAAVAAQARLDGLAPEHFHAAVDPGRTLVQTWCMRGSPYFLPVRDADVFTAGMLPRADRLPDFLAGAGPTLGRLGMDLAEAVRRTEAALPGALSGRRLGIGPLGAAIAQAIAADLPPHQRAVWEEEGPYAAGQPAGEGIVHFALRISTLRMRLCMAPREGGTAPFALVSEWLGEWAPARTPGESAAELVRRYLRCFGPATPAEFAGWTGLAPPDAREAWQRVGGELLECRVEGRRRWILANDAEALAASDPVAGVRLLPPSDPYLQLRDRATAVADRAQQRALWKPLHTPGAVLADGAVAGVWTAKKKGRRLQVTVEGFTGLDRRLRAAIEEEAAALAPFRGAEECDVLYT
ncbi:winged helix DNA-binding domain-containing protein [Nocardiopsis coralliicola]